MEYLIETIKEYPLMTILYGYLIFSGFVRIARAFGMQEKRTLKQMIYKDLFRDRVKSNKKFKKELEKSVKEFREKYGLKEDE